MTVVVQMSKSSIGGRRSFYCVTRDLCDSGLSCVCVCVCVSLNDFASDSSNVCMYFGLVGLVSLSNFIPVDVWPCKN